MGKWLRKLRGALGLSTVWGFTWAGLELLQSGLFAVLYGAPFGFMSIWIFSGFVRGFLSGMVFSAGFAWINRNRDLGELRATSSILLGAAVGMIFPLISVGMVLSFGLPGGLWPGLLLGVGIGAGLGAGTSYAFLRVARSGDDVLSDGEHSTGIDGGAEGALLGDGRSGVLES